MAQSFSNVGKACQDEMKNLPFFPEGSFGRSVVVLMVFRLHCFWIFLFGPRKRNKIFTRVWALKKCDALSQVWPQHVTLEE
jgi:hypothetical protein